MATRTLKLSGPITAAHSPVSAGLPIRLAATAIDIVIVETATIAAALVAHLALSILPASVAQYEDWGVLALAVIVFAGYFIYFWGVEGATPGKRIMGLTITRPSALGPRPPIGMGRAFLRLVGITAGNILLVDTIVAFLHRDRRALHDLLADSIVVEANR